MSESETVTRWDVVRQCLVRMRDDRKADPGEIREYMANQGLDALESLFDEVAALKLEHYGGDEHHKGCAREWAFMAEVAATWKDDAKNLRIQRDEARAQLQQSIQSHECCWHDGHGHGALGPCAVTEREDKAADGP